MTFCKRGWFVSPKVTCFGFDLCSKLGLKLTLRDRALSSNPTWYIYLISVLKIKQWGPFKTQKNSDTLPFFLKEKDQHTKTSANLKTPEATTDPGSTNIVSWSIQRIELTSPWEALKGSSCGSGQSAVPELFLWQYRWYPPALSWESPPGSAESQLRHLPKVLKQCPMQEGVQMDKSERGVRERSKKVPPGMRVGGPLQSIAYGVSGDAGRWNLLLNQHCTWIHLVYLPGLFLALPFILLFVCFKLSPPTLSVWDETCFVERCDSVRFQRRNEEGNTPRHLMLLFGWSLCSILGA